MQFSEKPVGTRTTSDGHLSPHRTLSKSMISRGQATGCRLSPCPSLVYHQHWRERGGAQRNTTFVIIAIKTQGRVIKNPNSSKTIAKSMNGSNSKTFWTVYTSTLGTICNCASPLKVLHDVHKTYRVSICDLIAQLVNVSALLSQARTAIHPTQGPTEIYVRQPVLIHVSEG